MLSSIVVGAILSLGGPEDCYQETVDVIHVEHIYNLEVNWWARPLRYKIKFGIEQVILWNWHAPTRRWRVVDWWLLNDHTLFAHWHGWHYVMTRRPDGDLVQFVGRTWRETFSTTDSEVADRKRLPEDCRHRPFHRNLMFPPRP
jgi:hypothetical protein